MPGPKISSAQGSLASLEERLRRSLSLAGLIEADFTAAAIPVVQVDDATRPGCNILRNRHFSFGAAMAVGIAASSLAVKAVNDVLIDFANASISEAALPYANPYAELYFWIQSGTIADPFAIATVTTGIFTEILGSANDRPPILQSALGAASGVPANSSIIYASNLTATQDRESILKVHLKAGDKFGWTIVPVASGAVYNGRVSLRGRTF